MLVDFFIQTFWFDPKVWHLIAQRISSVQEADRIIVLNDGKVDGFGTHEELLENNTIYRDVYEAQTTGAGDFDEGGDN